MIKINLLPAEKRRPERTPLPRFGLILADIAVGAVVVVAILFELLLIDRTKGDRDGAQSRLTSLKGDVERWKVAKGKNDELQGKFTEIKSIAGAGNEWWRILDALWEVIHDNPRVWIDDLNSADSATATGMMQGYDPGRTAAPPPYGLTMSCHSAGLDTKGMTKFRSDLRKHPVLSRYFLEINFSVDWVVEPQDEFVERYSLQFRIMMIGQVAPPAPAGPGGATP